MGLKSYFRPEKKTSKKDGDNVIAPIEMKTTPPGGSSPVSTPRAFSLKGEVYPEGDFRASTLQQLTAIQADVIATYMHQQQAERKWIKDGSSSNEGIVLKKSDKTFTCYPEDLWREQDGLYDQVKILNVKSAVTINTPLIRIFLSRHHVDYVPLTKSHQIQVIPTIADLGNANKYQFAAFVRDQKILIVWDDNPRHLLERAASVENDLMDMIWDLEAKIAQTPLEKKTPHESTVDLGTGAVDPDDLESALRGDTKRETVLWNPIQVGFTLTLMTAALGLGWRALATEIVIDHSYTRLALLAVTPLQIFVSFFFFQIIIVNISQLIGPISQLGKNTKFYSAKRTARLDRSQGSLPHVTIQMPAYKEGLNAVLKPTIQSLEAAISTYERQGGHANIYVNDDGFQANIGEIEAEMRRDFYEEHNIGWMSRPNHEAEVPGMDHKFVRRGKFKKASNMNYALMISNQIEDKLQLVERHEKWTQEDENTAYKEAFDAIMEAHDGRAIGAGNVRIGDYILLIDSDTRIPEDCLLDAVSEMEASPEVGILQYSSGVMNVSDSFFENGITFFTDLIYTAIRYTVANGDVSPFVGHNAILRWSAVQQVSYEDEDGYEKFWSESHVSEDFDMSLRLQVAGYIIRLAAYAGDGFKEGVSLTVYDELARWEKYAYGCNELLFHPLRYWFTRGPITPLFRKFITSNIRTTSKLTICSYIGTYYAIGAAWILTILNYFLVGWFNGHLDKYYLDSFKVYFALIIVFSALGNVSLAIFRYRMVERSFLGAFWENFKWLFLLTIFLGGISLHVSQALLSHFLSINMEWGSTTKEIVETTLQEEVPKTLKRFKGTFGFCFLMTGVMVACAKALPWEWRITDFVAIYPMCTVVVGHFMLPIALNPGLMQFKF